MFKHNTPKDFVTSQLKIIEWIDEMESLIEQFDYVTRLLQFSLHFLRSNKLFHQIQTDDNPQIKEFVESQKHLYDWVINFQEELDENSLGDFAFFANEYKRILSNNEFYTQLRKDNQT